MRRFNPKLIITLVVLVAGLIAIGLDVTAQPPSTTQPGPAWTVVTNRQFYSALEFCKSDNATLIPTRIAANDWALARTAAGAETFNIHCTVPLPWRITGTGTATGTRGARLDAFSIAQQITVVNLTSNTFNALSTTTYANAVANAIAAYGGTVTITPPTIVQATPYLTAASLSAPTFMQINNAQVGIDFTVVMANTGVYRLYGISMAWTCGGCVN